MGAMDNCACFDELSTLYPLVQWRRNLPRDMSIAEYAKEVERLPPEIRNVADTLFSCHADEDALAIFLAFQGARAMNLYRDALRMAEPS
jgi:hypothetical protein